MSDGSDGRLLARPRALPAETQAATPWPLPPGLHPLGLGEPRDGRLRVPEGAGAGPLPLIVMLHGATGSWERALRRLGSLADHALVLLPDSRGTSWDVLEGGYGPDILRINAALERVFAAWPLDLGQIVIAGFSDGASYALSLALMNGTLFTHALCFSPGFAAPLHIEAGAALFLSHGTEDEILPIDACSRRLMPMLERAGFFGQYMEFPGKHEVPEAVREAALAFLRLPRPED